jgi:hypothetical protein
MLFALSIPVSAVEVETDSHRILYAGQNLAVGFVDITNDDTNLYVTYQINLAGWRITETHVAVGTSLSAIPRNKSGNPQVGHFEFSEVHDPSVTTWTETIPLDSWASDTNLTIATHAVVQKVTKFTDPPVLLATENNHPVAGATTMAANIYKITTTGLTTLVDNDLTPVRGTATDNFNGNAYDAVNHRFYFSDYGVFGGPYYMGPSPLYFNDMAGNTIYAGQLIGGASGGTFFEGAYYYISERTSTLRKVTFNADGTVLLDAVLVADIFPANSNVLAFGDIDIRDEAGTDVIYGSATVLPAGTVVFFSMNLDGTAYTVIKSGALYGAGGTQISFGSDGVLYGVNARTPFSLFSISTTDGSTTAIATLPVALADLASGPSIPDDVIETETAWGNGTRFVTSNWAMYFNYVVKAALTLVDSVQVSSLGQAVNSNIILENGIQYRLKAIGSFTYNSAGDWADAEYYLRTGVVVKGDLEGSVSHVLDVSVNGTPVNDDWGAYNTEHVYLMNYAGTGSVLNFFIYDSVHSDNNGFITIEIYKVNY